MNFDEIKMWREIKNKPAMFLGQKSIIRLNLFLCGINYAFGNANYLSYFKGFNDWYMKKFNVDTNNAYTI